MFNMIRSNFNITSESLVRIVAPTTKEVAMYGSEHSGYEEISQKITRATFLREAFVWSIGLDANFGLKGHKMKKVQMLPGSNVSDGEKYKLVSQICMKGIDHLILENYRRTKLGSGELIPLIFIVNNSLDRYPTPDASAIFEDNLLVTHAELRRCHRFLQLADEEDPLLNEIGQIARKTILFIKVIWPDQENGCMEFQPLSDFYKKHEWDIADQNRRTRKGKEKSRWSSKFLSEVHTISKSIEEKVKTLSGIKTQMLIPTDLSESFRSDRELMLQAIQMNKRFINVVSSDLLEDESFLDNLFNNNKFDLNDLEPHLLNNVDIMKRLLKKFDHLSIQNELYRMVNGQPENVVRMAKERALQSTLISLFQEHQHPLVGASSLRNDAKFMREAAQIHVFLMALASEELLSNRDYMLEFLQRSELAVGLASLTLLDDEIFVSSVLERQPEDLMFASERLQKAFGL